MAYVACEIWDKQQSNWQPLPMDNGHNILGFDEDSICKSLFFQNIQRFTTKQVYEM